MSWLTGTWGHLTKQYVRKRPNACKENPKVIVSTSRINLFKRCVVHLAPILTTILVLTINFHGVYIGQDFAGPIKSETINLLLLQVAAKVHEIMIGWSLALIVFNVIRNEMVFGNGLPLGLIGSGLSFTSFEYFFRKEFYAAVQCWFKRERTLKKAMLVALLVVSGFVATLSGPASATLLVPKQQEWPSGGTEYFLNGTSDDFWPANLAGDLGELKDICHSNNSATVAVCPAGGFSSLWERWGRTSTSNFSQEDVRTYAKGLSGSSYFWPIHSPRSQIPPRYVMGAVRKDEVLRSNSWLVLPHAAPAAVLQQLTADWWRVVAPNDQVKLSKIDDRKAFSTYRNAFTSTRCVLPQDISIRETTVQFPSLEGRFDYAKPLNLSLNNMTFTPANYPKFRWVHLPYDFGALSIGGLFESPWSNNATRKVIACSAQSGWVPAETTTDEYTFWTGWYPWNVTFGDRTPAFNYLHGQNLSSTTGRIAMGDTWLNLLTPPTNIKSPTSQNPSPSTIESIFENAGLGTAFSEAHNTTELTLLIESIVTSVLVDGISRFNSHRPFATPFDPDSPSLSPETYSKSPKFSSLILKSSTALRTPPNVKPEDITTLSATMQVTGYSYRPSLAGALAMALLLTHLVMATVHIVWLLYKGQTSGCWSYVSELFVLAYSSNSAKGPSTSCNVFEGTGAGIHCGSTFGRMGKVIVRSDNGGESEKVELIFEHEYPEDESDGQADSTALVETRSESTQREHLAHGATWPVANFDERVSATSTDALVVKTDRERSQVTRRVQVGRAYG